MKDNFPPSLAALLAHEGGYCDDPKDPGGATNRGVTQAEYDAWRARRGLPHRAVLLIGGDEVAAIYRGDYWDRCRCDDLPAGVDYATFDFAVNSGDVRAEDFLQRALGVAADGAIGPVTLAAALHADDAGIINALCDARLAYLEALPGFAHDGKGWTRRVKEVRTRALEMVAEVPPGDRI